VADPGEAAGAPRSRLAEASSAYLRSAAEQPIDWHPWGNEPFELARRAGRPVLIDIGASWCHWCHVMDEGTYADPEVARLLRQHFVAVKVDRDEHPEVDRRFQRQVSALTGEGGWPLTAFATPDGDVFYGGTYFPPTDGHGRPGFRRLLKELARVWAEEPARVRGTTTTLRESLQRMGRRPPSRSEELGAFVDGVLRELHGSYDPAYGGFGAAPKFPHPSAIDLLLWDEFRGGSARSGELARDTLAHMADGGLYDQLGGGFHRYSVDERWQIPHFEKMGVDNAELLAVYVDGYRRFADPRFEAVVRGTVRWSDEVLGQPNGGWGASQDADNAPGDDGSYYTWSRAELREALGVDDARLLSHVFGIGTEATMPHDPQRNVLFRLLPVEDAADGLHIEGAPQLALERACLRLLEARRRRPMPPVDRALYASINGRFLGAYAAASAVFDEPAWLQTATRAADRWLAGALDARTGIAHRLDPQGSVGHGLLDDQTSFARGLLELAVVANERRYLEAATRLLELVDREFRGEDGLLRDIAPSLYDGPAVGGTDGPSYPLEDSPHLSPNSAAALAFLRLGQLVHDDRWKAKGQALLAPLSARIGGAGVFAAGAALAAGLAGTPSVEVVVEGTDASAAGLLRSARRTYHPRLAVYSGRPPEPLVGPAATLAAAGPTESRAIVCFERSCAPPVRSPEELVPLIRKGSGPLV
jgi:uncharacterized protein